MSLTTLIVLTLAAMFGARKANQRFWPRQHGEIRPSSAWLIVGVGLMTFFGTFALVYMTQPISVLPLFGIAMALGGAAMIGFFFHRRILFRRRAMYQVRAGRVVGGIPYECAWQCQLGDNIERDGIIIQGVGARTWSIPGATSRQALSEALWCLKDAGVRLPDEKDLVSRFGITQAMIESSARRANNESGPQAV